MLLYVACPGIQNFVSTYQKGAQIKKKGKTFRKNGHKFTEKGIKSGLFRKSANVSTAVPIRTHNNSFSKLRNTENFSYNNLEMKLDGSSSEGGDFATGSFGRCET